MQRKDIRDGDELVYAAGRGERVTVLDAAVRTGGGWGIRVQFPDGREIVVSAARLARPGDIASRAADPAALNAKINEIVLKLRAMGYKENSPKGFRVHKAKNTPNFTVSWEILDMLLFDQPDPYNPDRSTPDRGDGDDPFAGLAA